MGVVTTEKKIIIYLSIGRSSYFPAVTTEIVPIINKKKMGNSSRALSSISHGSNWSHYGSCLFVLPIIPVKL